VRFFKLTLWYHEHRLGRVFKENRSFQKNCFDGIGHLRFAFFEEQIDLFFAAKAFLLMEGIRQIFDS
jgi:hypothetical protein